MSPTGGHPGTWGDHLVRVWRGPWLEHGRMQVYARAFPVALAPHQAAAYDHPVPQVPPVHTWADQAACALWEARMDHVAALAALGPSWGATGPHSGQPTQDDYWVRVYWSLQLAPLDYGEALARWCELSRAGRLTFTNL